MEKKPNEQDDRPVEPEHPDYYLNYLEREYEREEQTMSGAIPKTVHECAACPNVGQCDAHNTGGSYHHAEGEHPCRPVITADKMDAASKRFCDSVDKLCQRDSIIGMVDAARTREDESESICDCCERDPVSCGKTPHKCREIALASAADDTVKARKERDP